MAAILCLAIATGANTAAFTVVNGLLLRELPFEDADQLAMVALRDPAAAGPRPFTLQEYRDLAARTDGSIQLLARTYFPLSLAGDDGARMAQTEMVSGNYFETLRVRPIVGRFFSAEDDRDGSAPVAVLSHRLWRQRFNSDATVVGRTVRANGRLVVVAGVAPPAFVGAMQLIAADLWLPASLYPDLAGSPEAGRVPMFGVMGRLASGMSLEEAAARLTSSATALPPAGDRRPPAVLVTRASGFGVPVAVEGMVMTLSGFIYVTMALLMAVACANVAALVLARGTGRSREIAVRLSLGASRLDIARQLLTESVVVASAGCAAGTVVAIWLTGALAARLTTPFQYVSYAIDVHPDARVFAYSALATIAAAVLCGLAPIRIAGRVNVVDVIKEAAIEGRRGGPTRTLNAIVAVQFAVSTALLVAAGMLVRTYLGARAERPAVDTAGILISTIDVEQARLDREAGMRWYEEALGRLGAIPGVLGVGLAREVPLAAAQAGGVVADAGAGSPQPGQSVAASATVVSPTFFATLGLSIREGRAFAAKEPSQPRVAVVNEAMARRLWPGQPAVGRTFRRQQPAAEAIHVIGVVSNDRRPAPGRTPSPAFYQPFPSEYSPRMTALLRVQGDPARVSDDVRRTIRELNPDLSIVDLRPLDDLLDLRARQQRIPVTAIGAIGLLGLLLSTVGLYGVVAYGVRERAREIGIRLAIGARPADVRRLVLRQGFTIVGVGLALGIAATAAAIEIVRSTLFGVPALDPVMLAGVAAVLAAVAFLALYFPARWAASMEPAGTLRSH